MRILFVCPYIPSQIRVRPYNLLHALAERGHEISLVALQPPGEPDTTLPQLREWCEAVHIIPLSRNQILLNEIRGLLSSLPLQAAYSRSPAFDHFIQDLLSREQFEVAHVEHLRGALLADSLGDLPIVFDSVDSIALLFEKVLKDAPNLKSRVMAGIDLGRTRRFEGRLTARFPMVAVTSAADRQAMITLGSTADCIRVIPNGVDLDYFQPINVERDPLTLVFTGKMSYHANIAAAQDLAEKIMPLVWAEQPGVQLQIVGKDPAPVIQVLGQNPNITVTGYVPDLRPYLAGASMAVSTVRYGVGIQNKVLEALAMMTPVVCSPQACSALTTESGRDLLVGDTPAAIAHHILDLLMSPEKCAAMGAAGRRYVEQHHHWAGAAARFEESYHEAIAGHRRSVVVQAEKE